MALSRNNTRSSIIENSFLFTACEQGDFQTIEKNLNSFSSSEICLIRDENNASLIHYASRYGHLNILKYFLDIKHIDISQLRTKHGATCAHDAAVCDQMEILRYIFHYNQRNFSQKLGWTVRDEQGNTPLHLAAAYNSINALHYLLEEEFADPHNRSYNGFQSIHYASAHGYSECVKFLLSKSPDTVNEQTNQLLTPLHLASQCGSLETIQILISYGANLNLKDQNGSNCLHIACRNSHLGIIQWLIEKQNANINDLDYMNYTPIHYAAASGSDEIINYLLEKKAKIISANNGNTPLHVAAENGQQSACAILIERGCCSLNTLNSRQLTAADLAENCGYPSLSNELRLRANPPLPKKSSDTIQLEKATVVRLVIKKRNVPRSDASNQVNEEDLLINEYSPENLSIRHLDFLELETQNGTEKSLNGYHAVKHEQSAEKYAPWLKMGNQTTQAFQQEIQNVGSNLRKVRRESLVRDEHLNIPVSNKQDISTTTSDEDYLNDQDRMSWGKNGFIPTSTVVAISKSNQFNNTPSQSTMPEWRRALIERRRDTTNGTS